MEQIRKTKIVGTIGPASENRLKELFDTGLNGCRLNYSHGSWEEQKEVTGKILELREKLDLPISLILDMQGPEIRTGKLEDYTGGQVVLKDGQKFTLVNADIKGDVEKVSITYKKLYKEVEPGAKILIDDGAIELRVDEIVDKDIVTTVIHGNELKNRKTLNLPGTPVRLPALSDKDIADLKTACEHDYDYVAVSFARNTNDLLQVRQILDENGGKDIKIIAKIENIEGVENAESIVKMADAQMVARGDLAIETDFTEPPIIQKRLIRMSNSLSKPVITATQMLDSMTHSPLPTRAEASDVANAIYDRTSAIMLSGECATGDYPVECVKTMDKIARRVEPTVHYWRRFEAFKESYDLSHIEMNVANAACVLAQNMKADAIVAYTNTGDSARRLAGLGTECPVLVITDNKRTYHQLGIVWNVYPVYVEPGEDTDQTVEAGIKKLKSRKILEKGDLVVVSGGAKLLNTGKESKIACGIVRI